MYINNEIEKVVKQGYANLAFNLKLKAPLLSRTILGMKNTPQQAEAEKRTIANALGQSWCMLNNRACNEFMDKVYKSKYRLDIRPIGQIHDAMYFIVRNDPEVIKFCNDNITLAMSWQDDPRIDNPDVKLIGDLDIFYPSWKEKITLRNPITSGKEVTVEEIKDELTKLTNKEN